MAAGSGSSSPAPGSRSNACSRSAILFGAAFTCAVSLALGGLLLRDACRDPGVRFVSGAAVLSLLVCALCSAGLAYPLVFLAIGVAGDRRGSAPGKCAVQGIARGRGRPPHRHANPVGNCLRDVRGALPVQRDGAGGQSGRRGVSSGAGRALPARARVCAHHGQSVCGDAGGRGDAVPVCVRLRQALGGGAGPLRVSAGAGVAGLQLRPAPRIPGGGGERGAAGLRQPGGRHRRHQRLQRRGRGGDRLHALPPAADLGRRAQPATCWPRSGWSAGFAFAAKYTAWPAVAYAVGFVAAQESQGGAAGGGVRRGGDCAVAFEELDLPAESGGAVLQPAVSQPVRHGGLRGHLPQGAGDVPSEIALGDPACR